MAIKIFLSTLSLRRATRRLCSLPHDDLISIHALLAESDRTTTDRLHCAFYFYPRSPCGERRHGRCGCPKPHDISIHALLAESDLLPLGLITVNLDFYPRSPCGERPRLLPCRALSPGFLSTLSLRRATRGKVYYCYLTEFLSTLSLRRATAVQHTQIDKHNDFYPRSPCGERPVAASTSDVSDNISIHALLAESDCRSH